MHSQYLTAKFESNIKNADKKLFSAAAVAAFIGAIHLDNLNELIDVISLCNLTVEEFKEALFNSSRPDTDRSCFLLKNSSEYDIIIETIGKEPRLL